MRINDAVDARLINAAKPIPIRREDIDAWLDPDQHDLDALDAILDNRVRPFFRHFLTDEQSGSAGEKLKP